MDELDARKFRVEVSGDLSSKYFKYFFGFPAITFDSCGMQQPEML